MNFSQENFSDFEKLDQWYETYKGWFSEGWKAQVLSHSLHQSDWEITFLHFCPSSFANTLSDIDEISCFSDIFTRFIQKRITWKEIKESLEFLYPAREESEEFRLFNDCFFRKISGTPGLAYHDSESVFHSNMNRTPFIPFYCLSRTLKTDFPLNNVVFYRNTLYQTDKDAVLDLFLEKIVHQHPNFDRRFELPIFLISFPLVPLKINKLVYDPTNLVLNYSLDRNLID